MTLALALALGWWPVQAGGAPGPEVRPAPDPCTVLRLPADWDVRAGVWADVTGDGNAECVLSVWRPWQDWPIARWSAQATPVTDNRDAGGHSSHVAVVQPLPGGAFRPLWIGSALFRPVTDLAVLPGGTLVTLETTYAAGRAGPSVALSEWKWTGFGFRLLRRLPVQARHVVVTPSGGWTVR